MNRIIKIGMDVHSENYTLCAMEPTIGAEDRIFGEIQVAPDYKEVICFIESLKMKLGIDNKYSIECGYEAGCLGYTLCIIVQIHIDLSGGFRCQLGGFQLNQYISPENLVVEHHIYIVVAIIQSYSLLSANKHKATAKLQQKFFNLLH